ncbi:RHS repeat domain-containing protein [Microbulbifer sp. ZKSA004]|uniref:RHS repeat domain-containing protein n=1 Tax=Microbulbifer sp. ZKSA004 TaxID=3243389 RepID=UPI004039C983
MALSVTSKAEVTVTYLHTDGLGSVVAASDEGGDLLWRKAYMPYGAIHENGQAKNPAVGYTGYVQDEDTGLTYMGARYYDPELGRFLQMDPEGVLGNVESNPMMFNRYAYANGNPYRFIDPTGTIPESSRAMQRKSEARFDQEHKGTKQEVWIQFKGVGFRRADRAKYDKKTNTLTLYEIKAVKIASTKNKIKRRTKRAIKKRFYSNSNFGKIKSDTQQMRDLWISNSVSEDIRSL